MTPRERLEQECGGSLFLPDFDPIVVAAENALAKLQRECNTETLRAEQAVHWIGVVGIETMSGGDRDTTLAAIRALVKLRECVERILHPDNAGVTSAAIIRAELGATIINAVLQPNPREQERRTGINAVRSCSVS